MLMFLAIAVVAGFSAWCLYPRQSALAGPAGADITFQTSSPTPTQLVVTVAETNAHDTWTMTLQVNRVGAEAPPKPVSMFVRLPPGADLDHCSGASCKTAQDQAFGETVTASDVTFVRDSTKPAPLKAWSAVTGLVIKADQFTWSADDELVEAALPAVHLMIDGTQVPSSSATGGAPQVITDLEVPKSDDYDWTGGPPPAWHANASLYWNQTIDGASDLVSVNGVNRSARGWDDFKLFAAGAVVGVGAAALVALLQTAVSD